MAVSPFCPAGTDPMQMIADGRAANPEDLVVHYALALPYAGQHGDDEQRGRAAFGDRCPAACWGSSISSIGSPSRVMPSAAATTRPSVTSPLTSSRMSALALRPPMVRPAGLRESGCIGEVAYEHA